MFKDYKNALAVALAVAGGQALAGSKNELDGATLSVGSGLIEQERVTSLNLKEIEQKWLGKLRKGEYAGGSWQNVPLNSTALGKAILREFEPKVNQLIGNQKLPKGEYSFEISLGAKGGEKPTMEIRVRRRIAPLVRIEGEDLIDLADENGALHKLRNKLDERFETGANPFAYGGIYYLEGYLRHEYVFNEKDKTLRSVSYNYADDPKEKVRYGSPIKLSADDLKLLKNILNKKPSQVSSATEK